MTNAQAIWLLVEVGLIALAAVVYVLRALAGRP
jgi:hypothetical protein